jgi:hypothetical protein
LAVKPFGYLNHKKQTSNTDSLNNFKSIIDRQSQNQKFIKIDEHKYEIPILKKSSSSSNNRKRIFNSCIENVEKSRPLSKATIHEGIPCENDDGNQVMIILNRQNIRLSLMKEMSRRFIIVLNVRSYWLVRGLSWRKSRIEERLMRNKSILRDRLDYNSYVNVKTS